MITEEDYNNPFRVYQLTEEELAQARTFSPLQMAYLYNKRAEVIATRLRLEFKDPNNPLSFIQQEAEIQGMLYILNDLLAYPITQTQNQTQTQE